MTQRRSVNAMTVENHAMTIAARSVGRSSERPILPMAQRTSITVSLLVQKISNPLAEVEIYGTW